MVEEMGRWLRRVRPTTPADNDWGASEQADEMLAAIHHTTARDASDKPRARRSIGMWVWLPTGALACAAAAVIAVAATSGPGNRPSSPPLAQGSGSTPPARHLPVTRPAQLLLTSYPTCSSLLANLRAHTAATAAKGGLPYTTGGVVYDFRSTEKGLPAAASDTAGLGTSTSDTSGTNDQEAGVDEPDIVKADGDTIVTITDGVLRVVDASTRAVTGSLDLTIYEGWENAQLLVKGTTALVVLSGDGSIAYPYASRYASGGSAQSTYLFVSLSGQPKVTGSLRASGSYLDARLIGSTVRLVVESSPVLNLPQPAGGTPSSNAANKKAVLTAPLSAWLPKYSVTSGSVTTSKTVGCGKVSHPADYTGASMLSIYTLDMGDLAADPNPVSVAADGDTVYATGTSLYITSNPDEYYCCTSGSAQDQATDVTEIHRFDIVGGYAPAYLGSAAVPGRLLSRYSLSDYDGSLRVATTTGGYTPSGESSGVVILNADTLKVVGKVDGLGKGEQIYAVRFLGPIGYVVTFRQTDPLYVLDLHNPADPKAVGALELSGYSQYLHDAGDGQLLGVGQEASASGRVAGLQVSLFDVSKPSKPTRVGHQVLTNAPGESSLDPHAFLYWQPTGLVVTPVLSWTQTESGKVLVLRVSSGKLIKLGLVSNPIATSTQDDGLGIQRSLIVHGELWTLSGSGIKVSNQATLRQQAWIPFG